MANEANLKPFQPGKSGNPNGRPKGVSVTALLREALAAPSGEGEGDTVGHAVVRSMISRALAGDGAMIREIFNRVDGKIPAKLEADGDFRILVEYREHMARMERALDLAYGEGLEEDAA